MRVSKSGENYTSIVYNSILNDIVNNTLNEGDKIVDTELARRFGISRTPIREALIMLQRDGFIKMNGREGTYVRKMTVSNIRDIYVVREGLETIAARMGAKGISNDNLMLLGNALQKMEDILESDDSNSVITFVRLDLEFHQIIVNSCNVKLLSEICYNLGLLSASIHCRGTLYSQNMKLYAQQHRSIYEAFCRHDEVAAENLLREHIQFGKRELLLDASPI